MGENRRLAVGSWKARIVYCNNIYHILGFVVCGTNLNSVHENPYLMLKQYCTRPLRAPRLICLEPGKLDDITGHMSMERRVCYINFVIKINGPLCLNYIPNNSTDLRIFIIRKCYIYMYMHIIRHNQYRYRDKVRRINYKVWPKLQTAIVELFRQY